MKIKYYVIDNDENYLLKEEEEENIHITTMVLSAKSHAIDNKIYDVIESILYLKEREVQIILKEKENNE